MWVMLKIIIIRIITDGHEYYGNSDVHVDDNDNHDSKIKVIMMTVLVELNIGVIKRRNASYYANN